LDGDPCRGRDPDYLRSSAAGTSIATYLVVTLWRIIMRTGIATLVLSALFASPMVASAAPKTSFITDAYAKTLVVKKVKTDVGKYPWKVNLVSGVSPSSKLFVAKVNWGKGPHIMIAVPNATGTVNMVKAPKAPVGIKRVQLFAMPK
jgi:hypothetical protein